MKSFVLAGNWKLNLGPAAAANLATQIVQKKWRSQVIIFPSALSLASVVAKTQGAAIGLGVQNVAAKASGALTGENSVDFAKELGCQYVLLGHSERRHSFFESNDLITQKWQLCLTQGLVPVLCIGETLEERQAGKTLEVLATQLKVLIDHPPGEKKFMLAYEPVWAIGTGQVASTQQVSEVHQFLESFLSARKLTGPLLYGGSVKADNAKELSDIAQVHGFLVGGASLGLDSFWGIDQQLSL